jgi:hypothetical protein
MDGCKFTPEINKKIDTFINKVDWAEGEELEFVLDIIKRMPPEDAIILMIYITRLSAKVTESQFFVKFANYFGEWEVYS